MKSTNKSSPTQENLLDICSIGLNKRKLQLLTNSNTYKNTNVRFEESKIRMKKNPKKDG